MPEFMAVPRDRQSDSLSSRPEKAMRLLAGLRDKAANHAGIISAQDQGTQCRKASLGPRKNIAKRLWVHEQQRYIVCLTVPSAVPACSGYSHPKQISGC
jgi:hypothetical protein